MAWRPAEMSVMPSVCGFHISSMDHLHYIATTLSKHRGTIVGQTCKWMTCLFGCRGSCKVSKHPQLAPHPFCSVMAFLTVMCHSIVVGGRLSSSRLRPVSIAVDTVSTSDSGT
jgi:hypothetical protein